MTAAPKTYKCRSCGKKFQSRVRAREHVKECQNWGGQPKSNEQSNNSPVSSLYKTKEADSQ